MGAEGMSILDRIGNTPLLRIRRLGGAADGVKIFAKAEWFNPGGSVKDRPILNIVNDGERSGRLRKGKTILDSTSGNAGISYAMIGNAKGYPVELCVPSNVTAERKRILSAYGARLVFTDPSQGSDGAIRMVREIYRSDSERYFFGDQYNNAANMEAHYMGTGPEIWRQTDGSVTHFVAGVGTSGTLMGTGRRLRELNPKIRVVEVQPSSPFHGIEGLKHMDSAIRPGIYDPALADEKVEVETEEAQSMARRLASEEGMLVGTSAGANMVAALRVAQKLREGVVVTIFPDSGERYLSEEYWRENDRSR